MNKLFDKLNILSLLLVAIMLTSVFAPINVFADDEIATSGKCGDKLTWKYAAGTLTIEGEGSMTDFREPDMAPWYPLRNKIIKVVLPEKLTSIGTMAFYECSNLRAVVIPDYVTKIGGYAFAECIKLESIRFGIRVAEIKKAAFYNCKSLVSVRLPYSLTKLDTQVFYQCISLKTVTIPSNLTELGYSVFAHCSNLVRVEISAALRVIPEWTFYGCESLTLVILPDTIKSIDDYAFKNCIDLAEVYFDGDTDTTKIIKRSIAKDSPGFTQRGDVSNQVPSDYVLSGEYVESEDGKVSQKNITVKENDLLTIISVVDRNYDLNSSDGGTYNVDITMSVENKKAWPNVINEINDALKNANDSFSSIAKINDTTVNLYIKEGSIDNQFLADMSNRDLTIKVVTSDGSSWKIDCNEVDQNNVPKKNNYSYSLDNASKESRKELGTEDCYQLSFEESAKVNAEVIIKLPEVEWNSNAFLYQVEKDGTHTRLQAVAVDNDGNAHFYIGAVDSKTEYVIGLNVPGEKTDDVIIPDELSAVHGAIERLERIEYVITGVDSSWGMDFKQVTWILIGILAFCIVVVGVFMGVMNKRKQKKYAYGGTK